MGFYVFDSHNRPLASVLFLFISIPLLQCMIETPTHLFHHWVNLILEEALTVSVCALIESSWPTHLKSTPNPMQPWCLRWTYNEASLQRSVRMFIGVLIAFWSSVVIPSAVAYQAALSLAVLSMQANAGQAFFRGVQRIQGALLAGVACVVIVLLTYVFQSLFLFWAMFLFSIFLFSFLALGTERNSYLGMQSAMVLMLLLLHSTSIAPNLETLGLDYLRIGGIVEGAFIFWALFSVLWPEHPDQRAYRLVGQMLSQGAACIRSVVMPTVGAETVQVHDQKMQTTLTQAQLLVRDAGYMPDALREQTISAAAFTHLDHLRQQLVQLMTSAEGTVSLPKEVAYFLEKMLSVDLIAEATQTATLTALTVEETRVTSQFAHLTTETERTVIQQYLDILQSMRAIRGGA